MIPMLWKCWCKKISQCWVLRRKALFKVADIRKYSNFEELLSSCKLRWTGWALIGALMMRLLDFCKIFFIPCSDIATSSITFGIKCFSVSVSFKAKLKLPNELPLFTLSSSFSKYSKSLPEKATDTIKHRSSAFKMFFCDTDRLLPKLRS